MTYFPVGSAPKDESLVPRFQNSETATVYTVKVTKFGQLSFFPITFLPTESTVSGLTVEMETREKKKCEEGERRSVHATGRRGSDGLRSFLMIILILNSGR